VSWLRAEDGIPRRVKAAYLSDAHIIALAEQATAMRSTAKPATGRSGKVIAFREGDAA
jgi:hypothetical protein